MTAMTTTQLTFTVTYASASGGTPNTLTWQNIRVRPTAGTPLASGSITKTGTSTMTGVATGANFGFLAEAAGAANRLVVQTPPSATATAGIAFAQQPKIQIQDQFGNARTYANRNADNSAIVTAARSSGTATLQGTLTATAANGLATFSNLSYNTAETITLQFTSGSLAGATSGNVVVSAAVADRLVFVIQPGSATYGSALNPQPALKSRDAFGNDSTVGLAASQLVTLNLSLGTGSLQGITSLDIGTSGGNGTVIFSGLKVGAAGTGKQVTATAAGLASADSTTFAITPRPITVTAVPDEKVYDGTTNSTGVPIITAGSLVDGDTAAFSQAFNSKDVLTAHLLIPFGSVNDGNGGNNYAVTFESIHTDSITPASATVGVVPTNGPSPRRTASP